MFDIISFFNSYHDSEEIVIVISLIMFKQTEIAYIKQTI